MASQADKHILYQQSVQDVASDIEFVKKIFDEKRGRAPQSLREDFCGTMNAACGWVKDEDFHQAIAIDIDKNVLNWGKENNVSQLSESQQKRLTIIQDDVLSVKTDPVDTVIALNFSYWIFEQREKMRTYFERIRETLVDDGILFLDAFSGYDAYKELEERRELDGFTYVWDQASYDPITGVMQCYIHFEFADESKIDKAFSYKWRLWTFPELQEIVMEAGFSKVTVYLEQMDDDSEEDYNGNGQFEPATSAEAHAGLIAYLVCEK